MRYIEQLIIRFLEGTATKQELRQLELWLSKDDLRVKYIQRIEQIWLNSSNIDATKQKRGWNKISSAIKYDNRKSFLLRPFLLKPFRSIAATIILILGCSISLFYPFAETDILTDNTVYTICNKALLYVEGDTNNFIALEDNRDNFRFNGMSLASKKGRLSYMNTKKNNTNTRWNRLVTPRGSEYSVKLADGTLVWINAESELRYPVSFVGGLRKVYLSGEAYFQVKSDINNPFIVDLNGQEIHVTGTEFNVKNYSDNKLQTTLVKGCVRVLNEVDTVMLSPGEQAECKVGEYIETKFVDVNDFIGWKNGYFVFREQPLAIILNELGRWYDFEYCCDDETLKELVITARLQKFDKSEKLFKILSDVAEIEIDKLSNRNIKIKRRTSIL